jgi:proteasome beta subunit
MQARAREKEVETGTTTVGLIADDSVVLAADKRATLGHMKASKNTQKIFELSSGIALTIAGSVADGQKVIRIMRSQLRLQELEAEELTVNGAVTFLANVLHAQRLYPFFNQFIVGGVRGNGPKLYSLDPMGGQGQEERFIATGSGTGMSYGLLEDAYGEDLSVEDGKELAVRTVTSAMERDTASGDGIDVAVIDSDGITRLDSDTVASYT